MIKIIFCTFLFLTSPLALAQESKNYDKMICSAFYVKELSQVVERENRNDKFKHCALSCMLTLRCGSYDAFSIGLLKEFLDLLGMGTPEIDDLKANRYGIKLVNSKEAANDDECLNLCSLRY